MQPGPSQISKLKSVATIISGFQPLTIVLNLPVLVVCGDAGSAFAQYFTFKKIINRIA